MKELSGLSDQKWFSDMKDEFDGASRNPENPETPEF